MRRYNTGRPELDHRISELIQKAGDSPEADLLQEMMTTVIRLRDEGIERGDLKIINTALKELRYAFKIFSPYRHVRKVAIFGSSRTPGTSPLYRQAKLFAQRIVRHGWMVITGAAQGIMNAGNEGAGSEKSFGVNIRLPFEQEANPIIARDPKLINFKFFFTRKLIFLKESDATVLFPGGFGTHDEGFETLTLVQTGKTGPRPIVCIDPPGSKYWSSWRQFIQRSLLKNKMINPEDMKIVTFTHDVDEAVEAINRFYRNYHSLRFVGDHLVIRTHRPLGAAALHQLNRDFKGLLHKGGFISLSAPLSEERNEPETAHLARIVFDFNRRNFSQLIQMIGFLNRF